MENRPPYPRLGELYRVLAGALDTKDRDRDVDRLAREGEYDWSLLPSLRQRLIMDPLARATDDDFAGLVGQSANHVHEEYRQLVLTVPLDGLARDEALPVLVEHFFVPHGIGLLLGMHSLFGGPELTALLDQERHPIAVVLDWFDENGGRDLASTAFPKSTDDKAARESIARWRSGTQIPDLQSIKHFTNELSKRDEAPEKEVITDLRRWMVVGRALAWLEEKSSLPFREFMRRYLLRGCPSIDIGRELSLANIEAGERLSVLTKPALLLQEDLKRTTKKTPGDQLRTRDSLAAFQRLVEEQDPEGRTRYHLAWLHGRWHALSGQLEDALRYYEEAVDLADYRAGNQQKQIVEETLVLAAELGNRKPLIKKLKNRAVAFGLFEEPPGDGVIEHWEIDHLRQQFYQVFPRAGRFPEAPELDGGHEQLPFLALDKQALARLEPDLRHPGRVRTVRMLDGQKRQWPQLGVFASEGRFDEVRVLLEHGASVDQLDKAGGSALLNAIQYAQQRGDRRTLDLLLERPHAKATLDRLTARKRLTPLILAVNYGEPDIVERLLAMGASADRRGLIDDMTPLYRCLCNIGNIRNPEALRQHLTQSLRTDPTPSQREMRRRYVPGQSGVFGDGRVLQAFVEDPQNQALFEALVNVTVEKEFGGLSEPKLLRIVELLLDAGADPNVRHERPTPGRTPLMLAAEFDSVEAFELMMRRGGDPDRRDAQGVNCLQIAIGFGSRNIVEYLRQVG